MSVEGNLRKMRTELNEQGEAQYYLRLYDVLEPGNEIYLNDFIGDVITISFNGVINCVVTGKRIKKTYGEGMSYDAFIQSPLAVESIIRPELSRIHEGVALRDEEWERQHHLQPHYTYLSLTSGIKVGVTRVTQIPYRWIDQGAIEGIILAETPYRQAAGLIEVALKDHIADKTNWRKMLKGETEAQMTLTEAKDQLKAYVPDDLHQYIVSDDSILHINYPILHYPEKVKSMKLDKVPEISKKLVGIKGQYLIFDDNTVLNIRSHAGYSITFNH